MSCIGWNVPHLRLRWKGLSYFGHRLLSISTITSYMYSGQARPNSTRGQSIPWSCTALNTANRIETAIMTIYDQMLSPLLYRETMIGFRIPSNYESS